MTTLTMMDCHCLQVGANSPTPAHTPRRGTCYQGPECTYLHRLPTAADNAAMHRSTGQDIFGREKLPDGLDNRRGAGSYERDMTTL